MTATPTAGAARPPIANLRIRFWGVQGSIPISPESPEVEGYKVLVARDTIRRVVQDLRRKARDGAATVDELLSGLESDPAVVAYQRELGAPQLPVYGGETTCVSVETADGNVFLLDGGSGIRNASKHLLRDWGSRPRMLNIFTSHEHLDHRCGLPYSQFCFSRPAFLLRVHGTRQLLGALDERYGLFSRQVTPTMHYDDPIDFRVMSAAFEGVEIPELDRPPGPSYRRPWQIHPEDQPIRVGSTTLEPFDAYHGPTRCVAYKVSHGPARFVFCTDHEVRHGPDPADERQQRSLAAEGRLVAACRDADLAYFDGQYFLEEYMGRKGIGLTAAVPRIDWGHGCIEDIIRRVRQCGVRRALIGHHDPERAWQERLEIDARLALECAGQPFHIELAKSDTVVNL